MFDTHIHTKFSSDSKMDINEVVKKIEKTNIGVILTEHMDLKFPSGAFEFDINEYFETYTQYRNNKLLLGVEIGMREDCTVENRKIVCENPFDYVIGSVHVVNGIDIAGEEYYKEKSKKQAYEEYLKYMIKCIKDNEFIDSLGHIDYISRYSVYGDKEMYYEGLNDYIDEVLKLLIKQDKVIEINTRRLESSNALENLLKIYKRYSQFGGKHVTIGCDAHNVNAIGINIKIAEEICRSCNLKPVYFKERKMEYI